MTGWAPQSPKRTWRTALRWIGLFLAAAGIAANAYHAGLTVGKSCPPFDILTHCPTFDPQEQCETWLAKRWPAKGHPR
jgi:hypothetical protein